MDVSVGIDFGNRQSSYAYRVSSTKQFCEDDLSYGQMDTVINMSTDVRQFDGSKPGSNITDFKVMLGLKYDSVEVRNIAESRNMEIIRNSSGFPLIKVDYKGLMIEMSTEQLAATYLAELLSPIQGLRHCTIAVNPSWGDRQRNSLLLAAYVAGLRNTQVINSSLALALGLWVKGKAALPEKGTETSIIMDMGYSCFTICLCTIAKQSVEVLNTFCDSTISIMSMENDLMDILVRIIKSELSVRHHTLPRDQENLKRLVYPHIKPCLESLVLRQHPEMKIPIPTLGKTLTLVIPPNEVDQLISKYEEKLLFHVNRTENRAEALKRRVDNYILIGGFSQIPIINSKSLTLFNEKRLHFESNLITCGCSLFSELKRGLCQTQLIIKDITTREVFVVWKDPSGEEHQITAVSLFQKIPFSNDVSLLCETDTTCIIKDSAAVIAKVKLSFLPLSCTCKLNVSVNHDGITTVTVHKRGMDSLKNPVDVQAEIDYESVIKGVDPDELRWFERSMRIDDQNYLRQEQSKNAFFEKLAQMENLSQGEILPFIHPSKIELFKQLLRESREWSYTSKGNSGSEFDEKRTKIESIGDPALRRSLFYKNFVVYCSDLKRRARVVLNLLSENTKLPKVKRSEFIRETTEFIQWVDAMVTATINTPRYEDPPIDEVEGLRKIEEIEKNLSTELSKPSNYYRGPKSARTSLQKRILAEHGPLSSRAIKASPEAEKVNQNHFTLDVSNERFALQE